MKNKVLKVIRFTSLLLVILLFLPSFSLWAVEAPAAEEQGTVPEGVTVVSEDESKRTAFEKHYLLSDGTYYAVSYAEAVHEQDEQGNWVDVDAAPAYDSKDSSYKVKGKQYSADFDTAEGKASLVNKKGQALTWHYELIGASDEKAVMKLEKKNAKAKSGKNASPKGKKVSDQNAFELPQSKGELLFEDAFGAFHAEVRYTVSPQKIKEDVILYEKGEVYALCMVVENCDYKARLEDNAVIFEDGKGNAYFYIDAPLMYDAAGASSTDVQVLLKQTGKTVTVTYTPNKEWLDSTERVYPVTFDPAVTTEDYESNMEDGYLLNNGNACYTNNNRLYVGKVSGVEAQAFLNIKFLPVIGTLPVIQASLNLPTYTAVNSKLDGQELLLEQVNYDGWLESLTFSTDVTPVSEVNSTIVATGDTAYQFNVLTSSLIERCYLGQSICYRVRFSSVPSSGVLYLGSLNNTNENLHPVLTIRYGYNAPNFGTSQYFLCDANITAATHDILKVSGSSLSMVAYNEYEARAAMSFEDGENGGVYIHADYDLQYLNAENGATGYPESGSAVNGGSTAISEWVVLETVRGGYLILWLNDPGLAMTRTDTGIQLSELNSNLQEDQLWYLSNVGTIPFYDGMTTGTGIYYINNLSSRTFMVMNSATATTPILTAGTESALGDKMAWEISYIGSGKYTIESMLNPGYYLTVSSSGVALEFLDSNTLPNKALFTISQSGSGIYVIKSETNHYLAKNSSTDTIGTATSALERAKWRMCLKSEYVQFEELDCRIPIFKDENTTLSMLNQHTWDTIDDFTAFTVSSTTVTLNGATVTCNDEGTVTLNSTHIPTGTTCSIELFTPSIDMKNSNTAINNTLNRTKVWEYIRLYCNDGTISTTVNDDYVLFDSDCTNFASQCLYYGGMAFNGNPTNYADALLSFQDSDKWYYNDSYGTATVPNQDRSGISYTWSAAENFRQYWGLRNSTTIGNCYRYAEYSSGSDMSDAIVYWQGKLKKGDIVQIFKSGGTATHTMIVSEIADNDIWVSYHSENKYNQSLTALATSETYMNVPFCIIQIAQ